ncbi:MAG: DUF4338 domain-containing protein [Blastocatellia bacterium]
MPIRVGGTLGFCGRELSCEELRLVRDIVHDFKSLSVNQLASTICELLDWRRANGSLKTRECYSFLKELESRGWVGHLPQVRVTCPRGPRRVKLDEVTEPEATVSGQLGELVPLELQRITSRKDRGEFQQYLQRYHYLEYRVPVGAQLRYFIRSRDGRLLGCLLFTSAAWRMAPRDRWIGWDDRTRGRNLPMIVNQGRFLILPWIRIPSLASHILSVSAKRLSEDWECRYSVRPVLLETLVDPARFAGTCYRAANWIEVGTTRGRGRMDREARLEGHCPKLIFLYPLTKDARRRLCRGRQGDCHESSGDF